MLLLLGPLHDSKNTAEHGTSAGLHFACCKRKKIREKQQEAFSPPVSGAGSSEHHTFLEHVDEYTFTYDNWWPLKDDCGPKRPLYQATWLCRGPSHATHNSDPRSLSCRSDVYDGPNAMVDVGALYPM